MNTPARPTAEEWRAATRKWLALVRAYDEALANHDFRNFGPISRDLWAARDALSALEARERAAGDPP